MMDSEIDVCLKCRKNPQQVSGHGYIRNLCADCEFQKQREEFLRTWSKL